MAAPPLFVVRRCDGFYRFRHDVRTRPPGDTVRADAIAHRSSAVSCDSGHTRVGGSRLSRAGITLTTRETIMAHNSNDPGHTKRIPVNESAAVENSGMPRQPGRASSQPAVPEWWWSAAGASRPVYGPYEI